MLILIYICMQIIWKSQDVINTQDVITTSPRCHQHFMSESEIQKSTLYVSWMLMHYYCFYLMLGIMEKAREFRKTSISTLLTMPKPLTVWITINCGKFWKRWQYQTTWPASWETYKQVRKQQLELDMEQTGSK